MAADDPVLDARAFAEELTPVPEVDTPTSNLEANYAVALATCNQLKLANARLQAENDELREKFRKVRDDRRSLAAQVKALQHQLNRLKEKNP